MSDIANISSGSAPASQSGSSATRIAETFDSFLTLLTTQLKNQSPLDPLDTNQFTEQLVQFAQVEQQISSNQTLTSLLQIMENSEKSAALGYVGKEISAEGNTATLSENGAQWSYSSPVAASGTVNVFDTNGQLIFSEDVDFAEGAGEYIWDGRNNDGRLQPEGLYRVSFSAKDRGGVSVPIETSTQGVVTGVDFSGAEPTVTVNGNSISLSDIRSVNSVSV